MSDTHTTTAFMINSPKANNGYNGGRKLIKYNSRKRNARKRYKLPGLSQLVHNVNFFRGLNQD